jgi:hypothetical protein
MPEDAKAKARKAARRAQADFEQTSEKLRTASRGAKDGLRKGAGGGPLDPRDRRGGRPPLHESRPHSPVEVETLTELELLKEMTGGLEATYAERDGHRRAVRDLAAGGLLNIEGTLVVPTRAAVLFHELAEV